MVLLMLWILLYMADSENATATENTWDAADRSMPTKRTNQDLLILTPSGNVKSFTPSS